MNKYFGTILSVVFLLPAPLHAKSIAFLGDSITTGAVTNPVLSFDKKKLWKIFRGEISNELDPSYFKDVTGLDYDVLPKPVRLWPTVREYFAPSSFAGLNLVNAFSTVYLDTEQYSWAYILGRRLGYQPDEILIAARDGARMEEGIRQIDRVLDYTQGKIPEQVFVFFTGNDLCGASIEMTTTAERFASHLSSLLRYLLRNGEASAGGSDVYILGFLGIMQLTTSPEILAKTVQAHGKTTTCRELGSSTQKNLIPDYTEFLKNNPESSWFMTMFPNTPAAMCPTVFGANPDRNDDQQAMLANRIRSIRSQSAEVSEKFQKAVSRRKGADPVRFHFIDKTGDLLFEADDIASDCFHLSLRGQTRVAQTVEDALSNFTE